MNIRPTKPMTVAWTAVIAFGLSALGLRILADQGTHLPAIGWHVPAVFAVLGIGLLVAGRSVKRYLDGDNPKLSGIKASRIAALATTSAIAGALLAGAYAAVVITVVTTLNPAGQGPRIWQATAAALVTAALAILGLIVERWCQIPPSDTEDSTAEATPTP